MSAPLLSLRGLAPELLAVAFPFHLVLAADGRVRQAGPSLQRLCPHLLPGHPVDEVLTVVSPAGARLDGRLVGHERSLFLLRAVHRPGLVLRGQVAVDGTGEVFVLASPWVTDPAQMSSLGLTFADFAVHDPVADFLMLVQGQAASLRDAERLADQLQDAAAETARLAQAERALAAELHAVPDLALQVSREGRLLHVRPARDSDLPAPAAQLLGQHLSEVMPELAAVALPALQQALHLGRTQSCSYDTTDRPPRHFEARISRTSPEQALVLVRDVTTDRRLRQQLWHQAHHDPLTGLGNRALLEELAGPVLARADAQSPAAVVLLDLDRFKDVNDALGHAAGDELLRGVAASLRAVSRGRGHLLRLGGDEFAALLPDLTVPDDRDGDLAGFVGQIGRRMLQAIAGPFRVDGTDVGVEGSLGIALAPAHGRDLAALLRCADAAMYEAKRSGAGVALWQDDRQRASGSELTLLSQLRSAIRTGQLRVHYQPLVTAGTGRTDTLEALVRWQHPEHGLLSPAAFVPLAERSSCIGELTDWVLEQALHQLTGWRASAPGLRVAVNVSARLLTDRTLPQRVARMLAHVGLPADALVLEVTETAATTSPQVATDLLRELHDLGVRLSIDDFGTGFTSLSMLNSTLFDEIKLDRSFVGDVATNAEHAAISRSVVELAHRLGLRVVGEGVEDSACGDLLTSWDYDLMQGYLYSRPVPPELVPALLHTPLPPKPGPSAPSRSESAASRHPAVPQPRTPTPPPLAHETLRQQAADAVDVSTPGVRGTVDELVRLAGQLCDTPISLVNLVGADTVRTAARYGLDATEIPRDQAFCAYALDRDLLEVHDLRGDLRFTTHPLVTPDDGLRFYAGATLRDTHGHALGTICVMDRRPRTLSSEQRTALQALARTAAKLLQTSAEPA